MPVSSINLTFLTEEPFVNGEIRLVAELCKKLYLGCKEKGKAFHFISENFNEMLSNTTNPSNK